MEWGLKYALLKGVFQITSSGRERVSEIFNDMKHARPLCDSWASCSHVSDDVSLYV